MIRKASVAYSLVAPTRDRVPVYDICGARVRELACCTDSVGSQQVARDERDGRGREVGLRADARGAAV